VDLKTGGNTPEVHAVADGQMTRCEQANANAPNRWGWSATLRTDSGQEFFYTHLDESIMATCGAAGGAVSKGQVIGRVAARGSGTKMVHFATSSGNPCDFLKGCVPASGGLQLEPTLLAQCM
jgi:hypothetical protein